jgi:tyrosyl-tRNA synthetase
MKLAEFQALGHKVIMLIGGFTAMIGDPTDKLATRQPLTRKQVLENCKNYKKQAGKILNFTGRNKVEVKYNNKWLDKMSFADVIEVASKLTVQQLLERDMFDKRMKEGKEIGLHEFLYPLMQGYDSVAMDVDGEVGGNDQTFNMLVGRTLLKKIFEKEKFVVTNKLLADPSGVKMGKTTGNMITLDDSAEEKFGKVMAWTDGMIVGGFELCTRVSSDEIETIQKRLKSDENPRDLKLELAEKVTKLYHGAANAKKAKENFLQMFQKKEKPDEIKEIDLAGKTIVEVLVGAGFVKSNSEARRNLEQKGVKVNDTVVEALDYKVKSGDVVQKGKRFFIKIK